MYLSYKHRNEGAAGAAMAGLTRPPVLRRTMIDVADGQLLDVREISFTELSFTDEESALDRALKRILMSAPGCDFNSFNSSIR
jgi:hypothetical protein